VLDLFAGSGALAIEALSRGAESATLVELQPRLVEFLRDQLAELGLDERAELWTGDAREFVSRPAPVSFDLVLVDPPYAERELYVDILRGLLEGGWLAPSAVIVAEHDRSDAIVWPAGIVVDARRDHGSSVLEFLSRE
jgi:16S rRNA (guanine966-N2)-methyltransferase